MNQTTQQIEMVCAELAKILTELMKRPAPKGQQVVIHVSKDWQEVWIEKPSEMIRIRL